MTRRPALQAPVVPDDKPVLAASEAATAVTENETQPIQTIATDDKIEPSVPATTTSDDVVPPTPVAKETAVEDKKVEEPAVASTSETAATPAVSTPKKVSRFRCFTAIEIISLLISFFYLCRRRRVSLLVSLECLPRLRPRRRTRSTRYVPGDDLEVMAY